MNAGSASVRQLVERAKDGRLSADEIDAVAQRLKHEMSGRSTYSLLYVLSRTRATRHEAIVASFLDHQDDPMVARLALQTLCSFWGYASRYLDYLRRFAMGVEWDYCGDVRQVAFSAAGEFLRENRDCELFRIVYSACSEAVPGDFEERVALEALARALGKPLAESLSAKQLEGWRPELLAQGSVWLELHCGNE